MPGFLERLSRKIYDTHKEHLGDVCIVLPNRRASLFIRKQLGEILEKTSFLPGFYSIEDFVTSLTGHVLADQLGLQFRLYDIHREIEGEHARSIEEFMPYASWMISDFNEIDMYLVDQQKLFTHLGDIKEMSLWNPDGRELNDFEKRYLAFIRSTGDYYQKLQNVLNSEKQAYQGMAFRQLAENIETAAEGMKWHKIIFAGFNALTYAEEKIIRYLLNAGMAEVYWDADKYYIEQEGQEAGEFLKRYFKILNDGPVQWVEDNFSQTKEIEIIGVPKNTGQAKHAGEIIKQLIVDKGSLDKTALVLPDEDMLIPVLNSIPEEAGKFNVTMGLALRSTPAFSLLDNILNLNINASRLSEIKPAKANKYFSKDLIRVFDHPWFRLLDSTTHDEDICYRIRKSNRVLFSMDEILALFHDDHPVKVDQLHLFPGSAMPESMLAVFSTLITSLRSVMISSRDEEKQAYSIELEYLFRFNALIKRLADLINKYRSIDTLKTLQMIFRQLSGQTRIPFYGEPLQGLQVMGVLETRTLDFDTLIMLSVNEGSLPSNQGHNSFIPHEIKKLYELPTYKHNNKVFAYHFYRLLQRARNIYLLYNTESGQLGGGERSRYITQLLHEANKYNPNLILKERFLSIPPPPGKRENIITIEKTREVMELLRKEARQGFHPSSLNLYINCPLQFYLGRLLRVEEMDEAEDTIDSRVMGIVVHETLSRLLSEQCNNPMKPELFRQLKKQVAPEVELQFKKQMTDGDLHHGKNHLILNVAGKMVEQLLKREAEWLSDGKELVLKSLEDRYQCSLLLDQMSSGLEVVFKGIIDRIDMKGGVHRILDYKTGYVSDKQLKPKSWDQLFKDPEYSKALQLLMYAWIFHRSNPSTQNLEAGIISLRSPGRGPVMLKLPDNKTIDKALLSEFEVQLKDLLGEIFNPEVSFSQTEDEVRCKYCHFKEICNRVGSGDNNY